MQPILTITDPDQHGGAPEGSLCHRLLRHGFSVRLDLLPEETGPDYDDEEANQAVRRALDSGDPWAWFWARVTITHPEAPGIEGVDTLSGCGGYTPESWFQEGGYWRDMVRSAFAEYHRSIENGQRAAILAAKVQEE